LTDGDTLAATGAAGVWAIRKLVSYPSRSGGTLRRIDPVPTSFGADISRLSLRSLAVGPSTLWGLTFPPTGRPPTLGRYLVARLDPRSGRSIGGLRGVGPWVNRLAQVSIVMIRDRPWVLFQQLGVLIRVP